MDKFPPDVSRKIGHYVYRLIDPRNGETAHSTRVGLTQDLFAAGQDLAGIMQAPRWKSPAQPARYAQALSVEANAAAKVVGSCETMRTTAFSEAVSIAPPFTRPIFRLSSG